MPPIYFPFEYLPGPNWIQGKPVMEQPLQGHVGYMLQLHAQGILAWGGAFTGGSFSAEAGGLNIIAANNLEDACRIMNADPAIRDGICVYKVRPWMPLLRAAFQAENYVPSPAS
ncbi:YciI family protein [Ktedonobacter racemifer]|uniref:YCII-related protein n=1 Tax=Ktedonobacter racemifer DSM 44963 TaxID=485913 RepID=D6U8N7_KTERA|nr:YciI family protein [Ktedonobacter racemifer]EFH79597.1 YCII-related protein [Ktedonobacter racemifer DSM 44963]